MGNSVQSLFNLRFTRFLLSGIFNTGLTYVLFLILLPLVDYRRAYTIVYCIGILLTYVTNGFFVFRVGLNVKSMILFPLIYVAQYFVNMLIITFWVDSLGMNSKVAPIIAIAFSIPVTYMLSKFIFIFNPKEKWIS